MPRRATRRNRNILPHIPGLSEWAPNDQPDIELFARWLTNVHPTSQLALEALVARHCDRSELLKILMKLVFMSRLEPVSRRALESVKRELVATAGQLSRLRESAFQFVMRDVDKCLPEMLTACAEFLRGQAQRANRRENIAEVGAKIEVILHVRRSTGDWHDKEIAELISPLVPRENIWSAEDVRKWRVGKKRVLTRLAGTCVPS